MKKAVNIDYAPVTINRYINVMKSCKRPFLTFTEKKTLRSMN